MSSEPGSKQEPAMMFAFAVALAAVAAVGTLNVLAAR
mgnify:CR=1 FL=1